MHARHPVAPPAPAPHAREVLQPSTTTPGPVLPAGARAHLVPGAACHHVGHLVTVAGAIKRCPQCAPCKLAGLSKQPPNSRPSRRRYACPWRAWGDNTSTPVESYLRPRRRLHCLQSSVANPRQLRLSATTTLSDSAQCEQPDGPVTSPVQFYIGNTASTASPRQRTDNLLITGVRRRACPLQGTRLQSAAPRGGGSQAYRPHCTGRTRPGVVCDAALMSLLKRPCMEGGEAST